MNSFQLLNSQIFHPQIGVRGGKNNINRQDILSYTQRNYKKFCHSATLFGALRVDSDKQCVLRITAVISTRTKIAALSENQG